MTRERKTQVVRGVNPLRSRALTTYGFLNICVPLRKSASHDFGSMGMERTHRPSGHLWRSRLSTSLRASKDGFLDFRQTAESLSRAFFLTSPIPGISSRIVWRPVFAPQLFVIGNGKAMGFIADSLQISQRSGVGGKENRVFDLGQVNFIGAFPLGNFEPRPLFPWPARWRICRQGPVRREPPGPHSAALSRRPRPEDQEPDPSSATLP